MSSLETPCAPPWPAGTSARFRPSVDRQSPRRVKVNIPLRFCYDVLGLDHLHYGLWNGEPLNLAGLKAAQQRYTEKLCEWIPPTVASVLDVGAGTGATSRRLRDCGLAVEGLSPDPYQQKLYRERVERPFHLGRFQEFEPAAPYDLVLMSESSQYIWLDSLFPAVRRAAPCGYLLVADYFIVGDGDGELAKSGHPLATYLAEAERAGFELERREDVTDSVLPTLDLGRAWFERYVEPSFGLLGEYFRGKYPRLSAFGRRLIKGQLDRLAEIRRMVDRDEFRRVKRYCFLRFRVRPR